MQYALAAMAALVLLVVPGSAATFALVPKAPHLWHFAVSPAVSLGIIFGLASYLDVLGVRVDTKTVAIPVLFASAVVLVVRRDVIFRRHKWHTEHLALAVAIILGAAILLVSIGSPDTVPPNDDGAEHGIFAHRIELLGTVDPGRVVATDLATGTSGVAYYPMAMHLIASMLIEATGITTAAALHLVLLVCGAFVLPTGAFVLSRRLARTAGLHGRQGVAAGSAALIAVLFPATPWAELSWGGLPLAAGIALTPAVVLTGIEVLSGVGQSRWLLGAAAAGVFHLHNSEVASAALLLLPASIVVWRRRALTAGQLVIDLLVATGVFVALVAPVLRLLSGAVSERVGGTPTTPGGLVDSIHTEWLVLFAGGQEAGRLGVLQVVITICGVCLVIAGGWRLRESGLAVGLMVGTAVILVLALAALIGLPMSYLLTTPWYANGLRLAATVTIVVLALAGNGVARLASAARLALVPVLASLAVCGIVVGLRLGTTTYDDNSVVTAADRSAFAWLGAHVSPGSRVLNDYHDGSMWMYDLAGVAPVFGPKSDLWRSPLFASRWTLLQRASDIDDDGTLRRIAADWSVRYAFVGERVVAGQPRQLELAGMLASPNWRVAFRDHQAYVFELIG